MSHAVETYRPPTYADIEALPPHLRGEILDGELVVSPRPAPPHFKAASQLGGLLIPPFNMRRGGPGGWLIYHEPELNLGVDPRYNPVVPDLAGWHVEAMPEDLATAQVHIVPQWICEILSPSTQSRDRIRKLPFYARAGVAHAWLIDPLAETLEVYALDGQGWRLAGSYGGDETVQAVPFDAVPLCLTWLWGRTPAEPATETDPAGE